jgi:hypothetical protein
VAVIIQAVSPLLMLATGTSPAGKGGGLDAMTGWVALEAGRGTDADADDDADCGSAPAAASPTRGAAAEAAALSTRPADAEAGCARTAAQQTASTRHSKTATS